MIHVNHVNSASKWVDTGTMALKSKHFQITTRELSLSINQNRLSRGIFALMLLLTLLTTGCNNMRPLQAVNSIDTERFMGIWYVIAHIPPFFTDDAYNSVERYRLTDDGKVDVLFTYMGVG